jgi:hypothetical protein
MLTLAACDGSAEADPEVTNPPQRVSASQDDVGSRVAELKAFKPLPSLSGTQCDALSVSNGSIQLDAAGSRLLRAVQTSEQISAEDLHLVVHFGSGFPSYTCTDLESEIREASIDETWPATADGATFTVVTGTQCSSAKLELHDVVVQAPDGQQVPVGDIAITNPSWQWWHPFECHLLDDAPSG